MKYCTKCGAQLDDDNFFCVSCGNQTPLPNIKEQTNNEETIKQINKKDKYSDSSFIMSKFNKNSKCIKAYICPIIIGIVLILIGLFIQIPGGALTTHESLDGNKTGFYNFDDKYTAIDEYVGGDAYNYIIGASLVAGKISGTMTTKAIFIVGGILCLCLGITLLLKEIENKRQ